MDRLIESTTELVKAFHALSTKGDPNCKHKTYEDGCGPFGDDLVCVDCGKRIKGEDRWMYYLHLMFRNVIGSEPNPPSSEQYYPDPPKFVEKSLFGFKYTERVLD